MPELRRHETPSAAETIERDGRIEALLVDGLDRYFAAQFVDAINIWTRVLFLDRSHARARAYIDRARTALAERQRRTDEMLETGDELLEQGRTEAARTLLAEAVAVSGDDERAAALRLRLERVERAHAAARVGGRRPRIVDAEPVRPWAWPPRTPASAVALGLGAIVLVLVIGGGTAVTRTWLGLGEAAGGPLRVGSAPIALPVLSSADAALVRARSLYARGRLGEALRALDRVSVESPARAAADRLRNEIQQILLAGGPGIARITDPVEGRR
jgi:tetratricopeptide (TPR) repeat protein